MRDAGKPAHEAKGIQQVPAPTGISDQQLAVNQIVCGGFTAIE
jgi:hypothetical protein